MSDIKSIVKRIGSLKPVSEVLHPILQMQQESDIDMDRLVQLISRDATLTANLLKDANSAYYGRCGKFETVNQAVVFLGTAEVFNLVIMAACRDTLNTPQRGYDLNAGDLWQYSLNSAKIAKMVAGRNGVADPQLVFTVGILKDIGKVVLSQYVDEKFREIRSQVAAGKSFREAEKAVLGLDHAELGAMVATVWQFSEKMASMIRWHHQPLACDIAPGESAAVYMGDVLAMMLGSGGGADGLAYRFDRRVTDLLGMSDVDIQLLLAEFQDQSERLKGLSDGTVQASSSRTTRRNENGLQYPDRR